MPHQVFSLRRRVRKALRAFGAAISFAVGNHPILVGMAGTIVATAMATVTFLTLYGGRGDTLRPAHETSANLVSVISDDLKRNVESYNLSLGAMADGAQRANTWKLPPDLRQRVLFDRATEAAYLNGAYVLDSNGHVIASQRGGVDPSIWLGDRDYFVAHKRSPTAGLFISHPYRSRLSGGVPVIGLSRRIDSPDGSFAGVALLAIQIGYFQQVLDRIDTGESGSAYIVLGDGTSLARKPIPGNEIEATAPQLPIARAMAARMTGSYVATSGVDGVTRLYTFAHVPGTPLIAIVAPAVDSVLADWRRRTIVAGALTMAFGAIVVIISWLFAFVLRDKVRAQSELVRLASTDPLTGLSNRRTLDTRLDQEWRRALRKGHLMSALFIDIDYFKRFNDLYGHAAGDEVLAAVAECIASVARRSIDVVARYGGEEFAVVLPDTSADEAVKVAEKIRRKVQGMRLAHGQSEHGAVTVSVGCATCISAEGRDWADLVAAADEQMYVAKSAGRNQVKASALPDISSSLSSLP
ncbi:diguanylate cyclase [Paraburkholderia sp. 32]|uniref:diguanylate cyclase n=1 Tax=unclassified Paraburkholderia TaxID=2615204 RepID=UPI003D1D148A